MDTESDALAFRIAQLTEAEALIVAAIQNEDGTQETMQEIVELLHRRHEQSGEDDHHFKRMRETKPLRDRMKLGEEKKITYVKLLSAIRRERDRLEEGGALANSHKLLDEFRKQRAKVLELRQALRRQRWWTETTLAAKQKRAHVLQLLSSIDDRMLRSRKLATALINRLTTEIEGVGLPGPWQYKRVNGSYPIRFRIFRMLPGSEHGEMYDKEFLGQRYVEELVRKLNDGQYVRNLKRVPYVPS